MEFPFSVLGLVSVLVNVILRETSGEHSLQSDNGLEKSYFQAGDIPLLNRKIVRGRPVSILEHPYIVSIRRLTGHYLTGTLITRTMVVTIAHPLVRVPISELSVVVGENYSDRGRDLLTVVLVMFHEDFDEYTLTADLALVRYYEKIPLTYSTLAPTVDRPASVKPIKKIFRHLRHKRSAFVTGWGRCEDTEFCIPRSTKYHPDEYHDPMLKTITVAFGLQPSSCQIYDKLDVNIGVGMLCVGAARQMEPNSSCLAIPGAPLVAGGKLVGIQSWGFGCGTPYDLPLIYTNMLYYSKWFYTMMKSLKFITNDDLEVLFNATQAFRMINWLAETRNTTAKLKFDEDNLQPWPVDYKFVTLPTYVYDIRDFIDDKRFQDQKRNMLELLKIKINDTEFLIHTKSTKNSENEEIHESTTKVSNIYSIVFDVTTKKPIKYVSDED